MPDKKKKNRVLTCPSFPTHSLPTNIFFELNLTAISSTLWVGSMKTAVKPRLILP